MEEEGVGRLREGKGDGKGGKMGQGLYWT